MLLPLGPTLGRELLGVGDPQPPAALQLILLVGLQPVLRLAPGFGQTLLDVLAATPSTLTRTRSGGENGRGLD